MYECETCTAVFYFEEDCNDHMDDEGHWPECESCTRKFGSWRACNQHMEALNHWAPRFDCETCSKVFGSQVAANQHMHALGHWAPTVPCETCDSKFHTQAAANQHMRSKAHFRNYCSDCNRQFDNENNLKMHLNSRIHRGTNMTCPFCKESYSSASGLTHHLERSACPKAPELNRESIHRMLRERDPHGAITKQQLEWHDTVSVQYSATQLAFNGSQWQCYMCTKNFKTVQALNGHLNSPVHKQSIYHCPNRRCSKEFVTLAALFNHLESEACAFMRFEGVQRKFGNVLQGRKLIEF